MMQSLSRTTCTWLTCLLFSCSGTDVPDDAQIPASAGPTGTMPQTEATTMPQGANTVNPSPGTQTAPPPGVAPPPNATDPSAPTTPTTAGADITTNPSSIPAAPSPTDPIDAPPVGTNPTADPTQEGPPGTPPVSPTDSPPPPPPPSVIVSSEDDYWQPGEVVVVVSGTPNFSVTTGTKHQQWLGFGGTFNEAGWDALAAIPATERDRAIRLLFGETDGAALTWGRIPIGASDYGVDRYSLNDTPGDYAMENFSIARDETSLIPYITAAMAVKADIKFWASPWSPPGWMKSKVEASDGPADTSLPRYEMDTGWMPNDAQTLDAYALYFVKFIQAYAEHGIILDHVQPQNEPGWQQMYPTCGWGESNFYGPDGSAEISRSSAASLSGFVRDYLKPAISSAGLGTKVWFGTLSNKRTFDYYMNGVTTDLVEGVALQWETIINVEALAKQNFIVMQSEHRCGNYPWGASDGYTTHQVDQNPNDLAPNDFNYGQESWDLIRDWISLGVNIYSAWNMVLDTHGTNLDYERVWNQNALLVVDRDAKTLKVTPTYWVFRHLAQFVDVGAVRVEINDDALAFQNPDGSVVAVMRTTAAGPQIVSIDGTLLQFEASGNGWATVNWKPSAQ